MLDKKISAGFKEHIKKGGLITAPDKLLTAVLKIVNRWLRKHERLYRSAGKLAEADALCEMQSNLFKKIS